MKLQIGKVYTFKLNSGEELVAKVNNELDSFILVSDPLSVAPNPQGMGLIPSLFTSNSDTPVTININNVAMYAEADEGITNKYIEATTGLQVPSKKLILG